MALEVNVKTVLVAMMLVVVPLAGCGQKAGQQGSDQNALGTSAQETGDGVARPGITEKVSFRTEDGFTIVGGLSRGSKNAVLLLPQRGMDRSSYADLQKKLTDANFTVLAIDLRGHGESLDQNGMRRMYGGFFPQDYRDMVKDVKAAKKYLLQQGFSMYAIAGASIGANTAVNYAALDDSVQKIVLLSPGMTFMGIDTEIPARSVKAKTLIVASDDDAYSFGSGKALQKIIPGAEFMGLSRAGHGTNMFNGTTLMDDIVNWMLK